MTRLGVNVDPENRIRAEAVRPSGVELVRFVALRRYPVAERVAAYRMAGMDSLVIMTKESRKNGRNQPIEAKASAEYWAKVLITEPTIPVFGIQIGNEPDGEGASSDKQTQAEFTQLMRDMAPVFRDAARVRGVRIRLVAGALSCGVPSWLSDGGGVTFPAEIDSAAYHNYTKGPDGWPGWSTGTARGLHEGYRKAVPAHLPLWLTEFGTPANDAPGYVEEMAETSLRLGLEISVQFCWDDAMVPGFGLKDKLGNPKDRYDGFSMIAWRNRRSNEMATIADAQAAAYKVANPSVVYNPDAAICKKWIELKSAGDYIGVPIGPEIALGTVDGKPRAAQPFTTGVVLVWYGGGDVRKA